MTENKTTSEAPKEDMENKQTTEAPTEAVKETSTENEIDYKAEFEKLSDQKDKAEFTIEKTKTENKELKKQLEEKEDAPVDNIDTIVDKLDRRFEERQRTFQNESSISETIKSLTDNPDKQKLIRHHYDNSIKKSGFDGDAIRNDVTNALLLVDKKKLISTNKELGEALKSKSTLETAPNFSSEVRDTPQNQVSNVSDADMRIINNLNARRASRKLKPLTPEEILNKSN